MSATKDELLARMHAATDPARVRLVHALTLHGPQTTTELGRRVVEAKTGIQYHLGLLHDVGHVAVVSGDGRSRDTVWRVEMQDMRIPPDLERDEELTAAAVRMERAFLRCRSEAQLDWAQQRYADPDWQGVASQDALLWLTPDQAAGLEAQYMALIRQVRSDCADGPRRGARPTLVTFGVTPYLLP